MVNRTLFCLLGLFVFSCLLSAQSPSWHQVFPLPVLSPAFCRLQPDGERFLIATERSVLQIDGYGTVCGYYHAGNQNFPMWSSVLKQEDQTGQAYFLMARWKFINSPNIVLEEYRPGVGTVNAQEFSDSLSGQTGFRGRPFFQPTSDGGFLVFAAKYYRKFRYSQGDGFLLEWERLLPFSPRAVVSSQGLLLLADENGRLMALDADGAPVWSKTHAFSFFTLKPAAGGFIGAGTANGAAALLRLDASGDLLWQKTVGLVNASLHDVVPAPDGGFAACGNRETGDMWWLKTDASGMLVWENTYDDDGSNSVAARLLSLPDGGFLLMGKGKEGLHVFRTGPDGEVPPAVAGAISWRNLATASLHAGIYPSPSLFFSEMGSTLTYPGYGGAKTIIAFAPWVGGYDGQNELRVAVADYYAEGFPEADFRPGTVNTPARDFNRVWSVRQSDIRKLRADFLQDGILTDPIPYDILSWPAKGNPHFRQNADFTRVQTPADDLPAPFTDANGDGLYNVFDGDFPEIKGDRAVWWTFTDSTAHVFTGGKPLLVDYYAMAYTLDCTVQPLLENSLFVAYTVVNRSQHDYHSAYAGFFTDPDLGCFTDDYIGTLAAQDSWYVYNLDSIDGPCQPAVPLFSPGVPVQTVRLLNKTLDHSMHYINASFGPGNPGLIDPESDQEALHYLQGKWRDGVTLTSGGSGYNPGSTDTVRYVFPDTPSDPQGWSMCTANLPFFDQRMVASHGPFDWPAGDTLRLDLVFTLHAPLPLPCPDIETALSPGLMQLKNWYSDGSLGTATGLSPLYTLSPGETILLNAGAGTGATYSWSTGSTAPAVQVGMPGAYTVTVTQPTGCSFVENIQVNSSTPAREPGTSFDWQVWPNPASTAVRLSYPEAAPGPLQLTVFNTLGQTVRHTLLPAKAAEVSLDGVPEGWHWLVLRDGEGRQGVRRILIRR